MDKNTIIVTGFGPFSEHKINASWEAVKLLPSIAPKTLNLITKEIPVTYEEVDKNVKDLWEEHQPKVIRYNYSIANYCNHFFV